MIVNISKASSAKGTVSYVMEAKKNRERSPNGETNEKAAELADREEVKSWANEKSVPGSPRHEDIIGVAPVKSGNDEKQNLRGIIIGGNVAGTTINQLIREVSSLRILCPDLEKPILHISASTPRGEMDSLEKKEEIAEFLLKKLGEEISKTCGKKVDFQNTLYFIVSHSDTEHDHFHIVASRICFDGTVIPDSMERHLGQETARAAEKQFGLTRLESSREVKKKGLTRGELYRHLKGLEEFEKRLAEGKATEKDRPPAPVKMRLQNAIDAAMRDSPTVMQFFTRLEKAGVELIPKLRDDGLVTGISYRLSGEVRKGSNLGRNYTWPGLIQRGLGYEKDRDRKTIGGAIERESDRDDRKSGVARDNGSDCRLGREFDLARGSGGEDGRRDQRQARRDREGDLQPASRCRKIHQQHRADGQRGAKVARGDRKLQERDWGKSIPTLGAAQRDSRNADERAGRTPAAAGNGQRGIQGGISGVPDRGVLESVISAEVRCGATVDGRHAGGVLSGDQGGRGKTVAWATRETGKLEEQFQRFHLLYRDLKKRLWAKTAAVAAASALAGALVGSLVISLYTMSRINATAETEHAATKWEYLIKSREIERRGAREELDQQIEQEMGAKTSR